jgi:hypothetical protein
MSTSVDIAFVKQYETDVHLSFQRKGSKLRNAVRAQNNIVGASTTFQRIGRGIATGKTRHGEVPVMNLDHSNIEVTLQDRYAAEYIDKLDTLKFQHDERAAVIESGANALGRATDQFIIDALQTATAARNIGDYSTGLTRKLVLDTVESLNAQDVPFDDGTVFGVVSAHAWGELMRIDEFSRSEWVGMDGQPWKEGWMYRRWLGINWIVHTGLPLAAPDDRDLFVFHKSCVGHAIGAEVQTDITWQGTKAAWFVNNMMSQGAGLIDQSGVVRIRVDDDTPYT